MTLSATTRSAFLLAAAWFCVVAGFAFFEYGQGAAGYGITTRVLTSDQPVGFVATHPIFSTTIEANPIAISIMVVCPVLFILAARFVAPTFLRRGRD